MTHRPRTLALGAPESAFYRSLRHVLFAFGDLVFVNERDLDDPASLPDRVRREGFDQVLMPNPYGNPARLTAYRALRDAAVRVIASDRGALPDSWFFDAGFNFDSPSYAPGAWDRPLSDAQSAEVRGYMRRLRGGSAALEAQGPREARDALAERLGVRGKRVLFLPLQRPHDTVVRYFSGAVESLEELVGFASELERRLRADTGEEWAVILKKHPLETDYLIPDNPRLKYVTDDVHIHDLLELADATLVLNSGVGLLSLIFGTPTLHVGDAFYGQPGLAVHVGDVDAALAALETGSSPDPEKVERFVHHLLEHVYSFAELKTELVTQKDGSRVRITRDMKFRQLRILGEELPVPDAHVLVVTPVIPWPIYRGSQSRIDTMIDGLMADRKMVSLCVLNMSFDKASKSIVRELRERYPGVDRIEVRKHPRFDKWPKRAIREALRGADFLTGGVHRIANFETCPPSFRRAVAKMCAELDPDYVLVNYAKMTPALPAGLRGVKVLDTHDYQTEFLREDQTMNRVRRHIDARRFEKSEHAALRRYDRIIAINPLEARTFETLCPDASVHCVPAFSPPAPSRDIFLSHRHDALFVGSGSNFNVNGVVWFLDEVLPLVRAEEPGFRTAIVGNIARSKELDVSRQDGVDLPGIVPDLRPYYEQAKLVIAPILGGAGMKIKVVEAMGHAKPIVCTPKAAEGIDLVHGESAWIASTPEAFAKGILELTRDEALRRRVAQGGFSLHERAHSPRAIAEALHGVFEEPTQTRSPSEPAPRTPRSARAGGT